MLKLKKYQRRINPHSDQVCKMNHVMKNLIDLAKDRTAAGRITLAHAVGELHHRHEDSLTSQERLLLNDICQVLVNDTEERVRIALSEKLANARNVPRELVLRLAEDDINVAQDVILYNVQLKEPELIFLVKQKALAHRLAIARRFGIDGNVSQALVDTNDVNVIRTLLENLSASINYPTIESLVTRSRDIESWHAPLLYRPEITPKLAKKMYGWVSSGLREYITNNFDIDAQQLDISLQETVQDLIAGDEWFEDHDPAIMHLIDLIDRSKHNLGEVLCEMLRIGNVSGFERLFGKLLHLPLDTTRKILFGHELESFGIACHALAIAEREFITMNYILTSGQKGGLSHRQNVDIVKNYQNIDRNIARQIVVQWCENPMHLKSIKRSFTQSLIVKSHNANDRSNQNSAFH